MAFAELKALLQDTIAVFGGAGPVGGTQIGGVDRNGTFNPAQLGWSNGVRVEGTNTGQVFAWTATFTSPSAGAQNNGAVQTSAYPIRRPVSSTYMLWMDNHSISTAVAFEVGCVDNLTGTVNIFNEVARIAGGKRGWFHFTGVGGNSLAYRMVAINGSIETFTVDSKAYAV